MNGHLVGHSEQPIAERLWLMFLHDLSEFGGQVPNPDGTFRDERLRAAFADPDWTAYILVQNDRPAGLALIRGLTSRTRVLDGFFIVRGARRTGIGLRAVQDLVVMYPGPREVAFQDVNVTAVHFWRRVAREIACTAWVEESRPVPGRPDLPPDVWISSKCLAEGSSTSEHPAEVMPGSPGIHARKIVTVAASEHSFQISLDNETIAFVTRTTICEIHRYYKAYATRTGNTRSPNTATARRASARLW